MQDIYNLMSPLPFDTTLIIVDVQRAYNDPRWGQRNNPQAEANIAKLLRGWRRTQRPVIHIQHRSSRPESLFHPARPGFELKPEAEPLAAEPVIFKSVDSSFIGTDLEQRLRAAGASALVIAGLTTDHSVSTTARTAGNLGFTTYIPSDATATFERIGPDGRHLSAEQMHDSALASLQGKFATVAHSASVLSRL